MYLRLTLRANDPNRFNPNNATEIFTDLNKLRDALKGWNLTQNCRFISNINPNKPGWFTISIDGMPNIPPHNIQGMVLQLLNAARLAGQYSLFRIETGDQPLPASVIVSDQPTPEHAAVRKGDLNAVVEFLKRGVNLDAADSDAQNMNFLGIASECGHDAIAKLLLENGANPNIACGQLLETAIYFAIRSARIDILKLLLARDANVHVTNRIGRKPMDIAIEKWQAEPNNTQRTACISELLDHGAGIGANLSALPLEMLKDKVIIGATLPIDFHNVLVPSAPAFLKNTFGHADVWLRRIRLFINSPETVLSFPVRQTLTQLVQKLNRIGSLSELARQQVAKSLLSNRSLLFKNHPVCLGYTDTKSPELHLNLKVGDQNILPPEIADDMLCDVYLQTQLSNIYIKQLCDDLHEKSILLKGQKNFSDGVRLLQVRLELLWRYHQNKNHPDIAFACLELAIFYKENKQYQSAIYTFEKAKEVFFFLTREINHVGLVHQIVIAQDHINSIRKLYTKELAAEKICEEQLCDLAVNGLLSNKSDDYDKARKLSPSKELSDLFIKRAVCRGVYAQGPITRKITIQNDYKSTIGTPKP